MDIKMNKGIRRPDKIGYWWMHDILRYGWEVVRVVLSEDEFMICKTGKAEMESIPMWICEFIYIGEKPTQEK